MNDKLSREDFLRSKLGYAERTISSLEQKLELVYFQLANYQDFAKEEFERMASYRNAARAERDDARKWARRLYRWYRGAGRSLMGLMREHREQGKRVEQLEICLAALMYWMDKAREDRVGSTPNDDAEWLEGFNACWEKCGALLADRAQE